jgi:flavin-dependent dehydrogenase
MSAYDVVVIGGGLAGCSAAISLAQQGARVAVYEAKAYPHHKVCGEFLSPECVAIFDDLGVLPAVHAHKPASIDRACVTTPQGLIWETDLPAAGIGLSRYALDALLAERARSLGVDLFEQTTVTDAQGSFEHGFVVAARTAQGHSQTRARAVVAAHGKRASLDRVLNRAFLRRQQPFIGLKMHLRGAPIPRRVELHTFPGGYCGLSEIEDGVVNACLLVREDIFQSAGGGVAGFVAWMLRQNERLGGWFATAQPLSDRWLSISQVPFVPKPAVEHDILMVGDSAGLIAPLAGNGMSMALRGGQLAAQRLEHYLTGKLTADDLRRVYPADWRREFGLRLRLGRLLQAVMLRPTWTEQGVRLVRALPPIGGYMVAHTRAANPLRRST